MKTTEYIDAIKEKHGLTSDYQVSKVLGIGTSRIANYRMGRSFINDELAIKIAESLDIPLGQVLLDIHLERAKNESLKKAWLDISKKISGTAAAVLLSTGVHFALNNGSNDNNISMLEKNAAIICILC